MTPWGGEVWMWMHMWVLGVLSECNSVGVTVAVSVGVIVIFVVASVMNNLHSPGSLAPARFEAETRSRFLLKR